MLILDMQQNLGKENLKLRFKAGKVGTSYRLEA